MVKTQELEFIPPKKRKEPKIKDGTGKNIQGNSANADHITKIQVKSTEGLKSSSSKKQSGSSELIDVPIAFHRNGNHTETEENELNLYENVSQKPLRSSTATPSSAMSEESSFDGIDRASKSQESILKCGTGGKKKVVNIRTDLDCIGNERKSPSVKHSYADLESGSSDSIFRKSSTDNYLTLAGTIKRGKKLGEEFNVQLNISRDELEKINSFAMKKSNEEKNGSCCVCKLGTGLHVLLWTIICFPIVVVISGVYCFYIGTLTWYNLFNFFSQEKTILHRIFVPPLLFVAYPVTILLFTAGLALYGGFKQLSLRFHVWFNEVCDLEKGFYGWLCGFLSLSECSPYEVIILTDIRDDPLPQKSSTQEFTV
ncbi:transmembrane protein 169-like [Culicoides brevitarsis]|uniref:transmembrane protein 169-like n=1 Tax=Culicoides brevitarsis TaxID=469753 RepID=UPI00307B327B